MHRAVLESLLPAFVAMSVGFALLLLLMKLSGAKLSLPRLRRLHRCEQGAVQSLSFVLTLPLFVMLVMFIVQVSQLMVGMIVVNYAAFAAGRAAIVWAPAHFRGSSSYAQSYENVMPDPLRDDNGVRALFLNGSVDMSGIGQAASYKINKIYSAAVMALAPISPSHTYLEPVSCPSCPAQVDVVQAMYQQLDPLAAANTKMPERLRNKLSYATWNTALDISFIAKDYERGPTYNPRVLRVVDGVIATNDSGEYIRDWNRNEVGWQDPIVIRVTYDFALLPGPGRFLAKYIVGGDGRQDTVAPTIQRRTARTGSRVPFIEPVHTTPISATVTLINEGFKPLLAYEQTPD